MEELSKEELCKQLALAHEQISNLSSENEWLASRIGELEIANEELEAKLRAATPAKAEENTSIVKVDDELLQPGNGKFPTKMAGKLEKWHGGTNLLCVRFLNSECDVVVSGGVDRGVRVAKLDGQELLGSVQLPAPVLALDTLPGEEHITEVLAACMDGSHHLLHYNGKPPVPTACLAHSHMRTNVRFVLAASATASERLSIAQSFREHTKYTVAVKWSPCGCFFASASHDKTVGIYKRQGGHAEAEVSVEGGVFAKVQTFYFNGCVEALVFLPYAMSWGSGCAEIDASSDEKDEAPPACTVMIAVRDDNYFHYVDSRTMTKTRANMNEHGDEHVSYTVMDLALSPNGKHVLCATDKHRHIVFRPGTSDKLRNFYGHTADSYSQPRVAWAPSGEYVFSNSQKDGLIYVWEVASEKVVAKLSGHAQTVRGLDCVINAAKEAVIATASYDKCICIWHHDAATPVPEPAADGPPPPPPVPRIE
jgi:COMPASS component SWD3